jgi:hypothetical protein
MGSYTNRCAACVALCVIYHGSELQEQFYLQWRRNTLLNGTATTNSSPPSPPPPPPPPTTTTTTATATATATTIIIIYF